MAATADQVARVRRMVNEPTTATYSDSLVEDYIERYPLLDVRGKEWFTWDSTTTPPTQTASEYWIPTYDLNAAAADIWEEKAGALAPNSDFTSVNQTFHDSQPYEHAMKQCRFYRSKRVPSSVRVFSEARNETPWIFNLPEED